MRLPCQLVLSSVLLSLIAGCGQNGGMFPVNGKSLLEAMDGPKIPSMLDNQKEAAKNAEKTGNFVEASQIYRQILEKDPDNKEIILLLADSFRRNGDYDKAVSVYDNLLTKDGGDLAAKEGKGLALLGKGDFETPTHLFEEVLKEDNTRWKSLNAMGILFVTRGLYPDSIKYFSEALKQNPHSISAMNNMGLALALDRQFDQSINMLSKASLISEIGSVERKRVDLNLALAHASAGNLDEARKLAEIYFSGPQLNNNLGLYAHLAKDDKLAKSYLNMALTESKTYYGKAWENLESLNERRERQEPVALETAPADKAEIIKTTVNKPGPVKAKPSSKGKAAKKPAPQPEAAKPETGSLGKIIADELKTDNGGEAPSQVSVMPNVIKETAPTPENIIDNIGQNTIQVPQTAMPGGMKSLGTIKVPAPNAGNAASEAGDKNEKGNQ